MKTIIVVSVIILITAFLVLAFFIDWNAVEIWLNKSITELSIGELIMIIMIISAIFSSGK